MRPADDADREPLEVRLFEQWIGMTPDEWDELGLAQNEPDDG